MMNSISNWMIAQSKGWLVLLLIVVFILFMIFVLPDQAAKADSYAEGSGSPDTSLYYTPAELYTLAETYGEEGRDAYVRARFSFDLIFPLVYGIFLATSISWLVEKGFQAASPWRKLNLLPVFGVLFDFLENIATSLVMLSFPERKLIVAQLAGIFTPVKWFFVYSSFLVLVVIFVKWIYQKVKSG